VRPLLLALLLLPAPALAQGAPAPEREPNRVVLALAGVGAGTVTLSAFGTAAPELAGVGLFLSPVAAAAAIHLVGRSQGGDDPFGRTLGHAALATLPALGLLTVATVVIAGSAWNADAEDPEGALLVVGVAAATAFLVLPPVYAAHRYGRAPRTQFALVRLPEGGLAPVAGLTVSL